ncbi:class I SAM-dependent methyltransferase [Desulfonatronospira sp.]|uniref:class I SAM-dependent methyltransferase n=1 Tax=Desulfonatronospira sp. TaxID=1962951 RepID=UPI0025BB4EAB|nr:class I SAM-dependent methyltransferase [Desulfonatronospira sp.]
MDMHCRICLEQDPGLYYQQNELFYWNCRRCDAVFIDESGLPGANEEMQRYLEHKNYPADPGYRRFLSRLAEPLLQKVPDRSFGLDYGCGPGPALSMMLKEAGHRVELYDPFFHPRKEALKQQYDFIACSETAEHFHRPYREFSLLDQMLRPGGVLGIMTCFLDDSQDFGQWYYRRDPTHVVFYRPRTFEVLAGIFGWEWKIPAPNVVLMQKNQS